MKRLTVEERLDQLALLLERDLPLVVCAERMQIGDTYVYRLFSEMCERLGEQAR
ncbi:MAG: hypothetical protein ABIU97_08210 [Dehalococcoidia bacterium]